MTPRAVFGWLFIAGVVALVAFKPTLAVPGAALSLTAVQSLAAETNGRYFGGRLSDAMLWRVAWIESRFNPTAFRVEAHIGDASAGLMQTLLGTAQWLARDMGYNAFGVPTLDQLFDPKVSMYFGAAYLDYLTRRNGLTAGKGDETIVRAYNGGPGGASSAATVPYWQKYQRAISEVG